MKLVVHMCLLCLLLGATIASASITGSTNPNLFPDTIDWCAQASFACDGGNYSTAQPFTSAFGNVGLVGLPINGFNFQALQEGSSHFGGSFPDGMGLIYTGVSTLGNPPDYIELAFALPQWGVGAYIQPYFYGPFAAVVELFDNNGDFLGGYSTTGNSTDQTSDLLFIGARDTTRDVSFALFLTGNIDANGNLVSVGDFEIGTAGLATPEPSTLLLAAPSMLGLLGLVRYRRTRKSQEVL